MVMIGIKRRLQLAIGIVVMVAVACGGGSDGGLGKALESVDDDDLAAMVLPQEELGEESAGLVMDEDSGFADNEDAAAHTIDSEDSGEDLGQAGRTTGYRLTFIDPDLAALETGQGVISLGTDVALFSDSAAASDFLAKQADDYRQLEGEEVGEGYAIEQVDTFAVDGLPDEALGLTVQATYQDAQFHQTVVAFRLDRLVGAAFMFRADDADVSSQLEGTARAMQQRIKSVLEEGLAGISPPTREKNGLSGSADPEFVGRWRIYSERISFDAGGANNISPVTRDLNLHEDGEWDFGSSSGSWFIASIDPDDWDRWGADPYGPERKIVLDGWNEDVGDGPIEESEGTVDFFWVIYHVDDPDPGIVQVKFGHP